MSLVYNDLTHFDLRCVGFFPSHFFSRTANLFSGMNDFDLFIMLLNNIHFYISKKTLFINKNSLDHCKIETRACISFISNYGLTAIDNILISG